MFGCVCLFGLCVFVCESVFVRKIVCVCACVCVCEIVCVSVCDVRMYVCV